MRTRKELGEDQIRITVRLPKALYLDFMDRRRYPYTTSGGLSHRLRTAMTHWLRCPEQRRAESEAHAAYEQQQAAYAAARAARSPTRP